MSGAGVGVGREEVVGWTDSVKTSSDLMLWRAGGVGVVGTLKSKQHQGKAEHPKERWKWAKKPAQVPPPQ